MSDEEALSLIYAINYPHRILQTEYRDVPTSTESLVRAKYCEYSWKRGSFLYYFCTLFVGVISQTNFSFMSSHRVKLNASVPALEFF